MTCNYPGCTWTANLDRCPAHVALFLALLQGCLSKSEHDDLAKLPIAIMLRRLPEMVHGSDEDNLLVKQLIADAINMGVGR